MNELDKAYIAGLFDGEGSVTFGWYKSSKNGKRYGKFFAKISQNDRTVLDWVVSVLGCGTVHARKHINPKWGIQHELVTAYETARILLKTIRPYLKIKAANVDAKLELDHQHCKRQSKT